MTIIAVSKQVPHLLLSEGNISPVVLVVGDLFRTEVLAKHADVLYIYK